jgi:D-threonine aldolase
MQYNMSHWYTIKNIEKLDTPALVVYPERVKVNIEKAIAMIGDVKRLRPHVKTHKSKQVAQMMRNAGIEKFKCATIAEAEMLGRAGAKDVVLAYQVIGPKLERFVAVIKAFPNTEYACLVDNMDTAQAQSDYFDSQNLRVPVYIDLNMGFNRTGIIPEKAFDLYVFCSNLKGIDLKGLHAYDGHIRNPSIDERTAICDAAYLKVDDLKQKILRGGLSSPHIIAGGSPTFPIHLQRPVIDCSPGTFIYWDKGYGDLCKEQDFLHAALLITRVISLPDATKLCLDLGHKSVAAENELAKRVFFLNAPELKPVGQSEEHLIMEAGAGHGYKIGDILYGLPYHICPTVALHERVFAVKEGVLKSGWRNIARDRRLKY